MSNDPSAAVPVVALASGSGTLVQALLDRAAEPNATFRVVAVIADRPCRALEVAEAAGVPAQLCPPAEYADRTAWDAALTERVLASAPEWVVTAGFMRILGSAFLDRFGGRVVNSHPALLPAFPGARGVADALDYGVKVTGTTVHLVDGGVDTGPILAQRTVAVADDDTVDSLHERIKIVERALLPEVVEAVVSRGVRTDGRKAHIL